MSIVVKQTVKPSINDKAVMIYTDGASRGNNSDSSISAYAYFLKWHSIEKKYSKAFVGKTNNQMEITAVIEALKAIKNDKYPIVVHSDSALVVNCFNNNWWKKWEKDGWTKKGGLKNSDLWKEMISQTRRFRFISFRKVKGHSTNKYNNLVDLECNRAMDELEVNGEIS